MNLSDFFPFWEQLTTSQQTQLSQSAVKRRAKKGTVLHNGSMDCVGLLLVASGQLRAYLYSDTGREITLYRLFERDICLLSASCIMASIQFEITIEAEKDSDLWIIPPDLYRELMGRSTLISNFTNEIMATRFSDVMWLIEQIMWKSFDSRLAAFLLEESLLEESDTLTVTHEKIANHLGTAREVVTRMLRYFQSEGLILLQRGAVKILDRKRLENLT